MQPHCLPCEDGAVFEDARIGVLQLHIGSTFVSVRPGLGLNEDAPDYFRRRREEASAEPDYCEAVLSSPDRASI